MKNVSLCLVMSVLIVFGMGCAFTPQHISLAPQIDNVNSDIGKGLEVGVKVVDERTDRILGHRSVGAVGSEMTIDDQPEITIKKAILESLKKNGFTPVEYNPNLQRNLKVEIREIKFYISMGFWTGGVHTNAAIKADAINNGKTHEEFYREQNERRVMFIPGAKDNERDVNNTLSKTLQKLHHDPALMNFLAQ
jgi:uncharacterized lipoprotein YajG